MNKKNAFTLTELLAVVVIISILFLIITPTVTKIINKSENDIYQKNINIILQGASDWAVENSQYLPDKPADKINITLSQLKQLGYVNLNIKNPKTNKLFNNGTVITISKVENNEGLNDEMLIKYNGSYKFSIEPNDNVDNLEYDENAPMILLSGDTVQLVNLNDQYVESGYTALSPGGTDITNSVTHVIRKEDEEVSGITSTNFGVYYIDYTVNDNNVSTTVTRTVIITDNTSPQIIFEENLTNEIPIVATSYDLLDSVTCTDNSGSCEITTSGNITLGVKGKYVIKYIARDESGNTITKNRVITIK